MARRYITAAALQAAGNLHPPFDGGHNHGHHAYGHSSGDDDGRHSHPHTHDGDSDHDHGGHDAAAGQPGAVLDDLPCARSWGSFLAAVSDPEGQAGQQLMKASAAARPRNANLSERVPSEGGALVPERLRAEVLTYMTSAIIRPRAMYVPMTSLREQIPLLDNPSQASGAQALGGMTFALVDEGKTIPSSTPSFGRIALEARKIAGFLTGVPNELVSDATAFGSVFLPKTIGLGLSWYEDDLMIASGTGVGEPQALVNAPGAVIVSRNTSSKVLHLDVVAMLRALHPASKASSTWLLSESAFDQLLTLYEVVLTGPTGQDIGAPLTLVYDMQFGCWRLLGVPVVVNDHQAAVGSTGDVMLVDLGNYLVADRGEMTVERSQQGSGFPVDQSNFRIRHRVDGRYWIQSAITLTTGQVTSGLVILQ